MSSLLRQALCVLSAAAIVGAGGFATAAFADTPNTIFVNPEGTDMTGCGTSEFFTCQTIQYAIDTAADGDTVSVAAGTYHEVVNISKSINLEAPDGAASTIIDGDGLDQTLPGSSGAAYGVVYVGDAPGDVTVDGFTIKDPIQYLGSDGTPETVSLRDTMASGDITISNNVILGNAGSEDVSAAGPVGVNTIANVAQTTISNNDISGVFQGVLLENNGPATVTGNTFHGMLDLTTGDTTYPGEGAQVLSDAAGSVSAQDVVDNTFSDYAGVGIIYSAGYALGDCTEPPCDGSIAGTVTGNHFALDGAAGASAIRMKAINNGNALDLTLGGNTGTVAAPTGTITESGDGTITITPGDPNTITPTPAPTLDVALPPTIVPGADAVSFDGTATSGGDDLHARYDIAITGMSAVDATQIDLEYSVDGGTTFLPVVLTGSTADGQSITGNFGPFSGFDFPANQTNSTAFQLSVDGDTPIGTLDVSTALDEVWQESGNPVLNTVASSSGTVMIRSNVAPVATSQTVNVPFNGSATITLNATDADGDPLTYAHTQPTVGTFDANTADDATVLTYHAKAGSSAPDSFTFTASDPYSTSAPATVTLNVAADHVPVAHSQTVSVSYAGTTTITLQATDADAGDALIYHHNALPAGRGTLDGDTGATTLTYQAPAGFAGTTSFTFTASDRTTTSAAGMVTINVAKASSSIKSVTFSPAHPTSANVPKAIITVTSLGDLNGGKVTVKAGSTTRTATVSGGKATVTLMRYSGAKHTISVSFGGTTTTSAITKSATLTVSKVPTSMSISISPARITTKIKGKATVKISAPGATTKGARVTIKSGSQTVGSGVVSRGKATITLPKLSLGQHNWTVSYPGTSSAAATSKPVSVRVALG